MKLCDYNLRGWHYKQIKSQINFADKSILLLKVDLSGLGYKGLLKNLLAIDPDENIIWIAQIPKGFTLSYLYDAMLYEDKKLMVWRGDLYCEIDPESGQILKELEIR